MLQTRIIVYRRALKTQLVVYPARLANQKTLFIVNSVKSHLISTGKMLLYIFFLIFWILKWENNRVIAQKIQKILY